MWHVDGMRNSIITTGNGGTEATKAAVTLFYNNGRASYTVEQLLQPGQQIWADVGAIIRNQVPDKDGNVIPPDVMMGSYELRDIDHPLVGLLYEGKLVIDKTWGHGYYGCATCCGYRYTKLDPNPYADLVGNGTWNTLWSYDVCGAFWDDVTGGGYNWASDNTGVATVASAYTSMVGVGSANGSALVDVNYQQRVKPGQDCPVVTVGGQAPINAQPKITSISPGAPAFPVLGLVFVKRNPMEGAPRMFAAPIMPGCHILFWN